MKAIHVSGYDTRAIQRATSKAASVFEQATHEREASARLEYTTFKLSAAIHPTILKNAVTGRMVLATKASAFCYFMAHHSASRCSPSLWWSNLMHANLLQYAAVKDAIPQLWPIDFLFSADKPPAETEVGCADLGYYVEIPKLLSWALQNLVGGYIDFRVMRHIFSVLIHSCLVTVQKDPAFLDDPLFGCVADSRNLTPDLRKLLTQCGSVDLTLVYRLLVNASYYTGYVLRSFGSEWFNGDPEISPLQHLRDSKPSSASFYMACVLLYGGNLSEPSSYNKVLQLSLDRLVNQGSQINTSLMVVGKSANTRRAKAGFTSPVASNLGRELAAEPPVQSDLTVADLEPVSPVSDPLLQEFTAPDITPAPQTEANTPPDTTSVLPIHGDFTTVIYLDPPTLPEKRPNSLRVTPEGYFIIDDKAEADSDEWRVPTAVTPGLDGVPIPYRWKSVFYEHNKAVASKVAARLAPNPEFQSFGKPGAYGQYDGILLTVPQDCFNYMEEELSGNERRITAHAKHTGAATVYSAEHGSPRYARGATVVNITKEQIAEFPDTDKYRWTPVYEAGSRDFETKTYIRALKFSTEPVNGIYTVAQISGCEPSELDAEVVKATLEAAKNSTISSDDFARIERAVRAFEDWTAKEAARLARIEADKVFDTVTEDELF